MDFSASYDKTTKIITALVGILMLVVLASMWISLKAAGTGLPLVFMAVVSFISVILPYGFSVTKYQLNNEELIIFRPFGNKKILLTSIASAAIIDPKLLRWSWRIFGSGGMFGYYGTFGNKQLGTMKWYLTRKDRIVLITTVNNKKLLLSPDDVDAFIKAYEQTRNRY
ncbi:PH domain-containing protein [Niabella pedocola]|uniref:PH domain-containing protein n=1 Tax=Niabella pedocola TaxID=1752077 RepID=A0ABS8PZ77_9BACT|nr:PH domain-containing protein [Niabella pedocola]MCD2426139.1 PH domain-containing protein [Niabella pedocola]